MPDADKIAAAQQWLADDLPGGEWILPHWQDGPYWLVPVERAAREHHNIAVLLDAHDPIALTLPLNNGWGEFVPVSVYALGKFTRAQCEWHHSPEDGLVLHGDAIMGPYASVPTAADLVEALPDLLGVDDGAIAPGMDILRRADPEHVLRALLTIFGPAPYNVAMPGEERGGDVSVVSVLEAVAGVVA